MSDKPPEPRMCTQCLIGHFPDGSEIRAFLFIKKGRWQCSRCKTDYGLADQP